MPLIEPISDKSIQEEHQALWDNAIKEYGDMYKVPMSVVMEIGYRVRGLTCLSMWDGAGRATKHLSTYMVPTQVAEDLIARFCSPEELEEAPTEKRADKYQAIIDWAKNHLFEQVTTDQMVELGQFSYPTTLKFLQESPYFRKVKKGLWEVRDPKADREAEKNRN